MTPELNLRIIDDAVDTLLSGGLVAVPTETVYGLAADADNRDAVMATFAAKGRPTNHPLIVHICGAQALGAWARTVPEDALKLAQHFWPGPLTLVLPKAERCGDFVTGGQDSVALRSPSHPWARAILEKLSATDFKGFTAPSANSFGRISPTCAQHVADDLGLKPRGKLDRIVDGGVCEVGVESTIVNLTGEHAEILRHGVITQAMLEAVLGYPVPEAGSNAPRASGRLKSHYAPRTPLELVTREAFLDRCVQYHSQKIAVMASADLLSKIPSCVTVTKKITAPESVGDYAHALYAALHTMDNAQAERILIELPPQTAPWAAVNDRLSRAAADKSL